MALTPEEMMRAADPDKFESGIPVEAMMAAAEGNASPNVVSRQLLREETRPDLAQSFKEEIQHQTSTPPGYLDQLTRPLSMGLKAAGAYAQEMENAKAAPIVNKIRALRGEKLKPLNALGQEANQKAEFGDAFLEVADALDGAGVPKWITNSTLRPLAPALGIAADAFTDPLGAPRQVGKAAVKLTEAGTGLAKSLKSFLARVALNYNEAEVKHLLDGGYLRLTPDLMKSGGEAAQDLGNSLVRTYRTQLREPAQKLYDTIAPKIRTTVLPPASSVDLHKGVMEALTNERDAVLVKDILDTKIGSRKAVTKTVGAKSPVEKIVQTTSEVELPGKKITTGQGLVATEGNKKKSNLIEKTSKFKNPDVESDEVGGYQPAEVSKRAKKEVVTLTKGTPGKATVVEKDKTFQDLLNDAAAGKDISAGEWDTAAQRFQAMADGNPKASKIATAILDKLQSHVPEYGEAATAWKKSAEALEDLDLLVGGMENRDGKWIAKNPLMLFNYFEHLGESSVKVATDRLDRLLQLGGHGTTKIKDLAAYGPEVGSVRARLTAVSLGGGAVAALSQVGVNPHILAAVMAGVIGESTPKLSAKGGRALLQTEQRLRRLAGTPAYKELVGQGLLRTITGRNTEENQ